jgi:hypothetical protein
MAARLTVTVTVTVRDAMMLTRVAASSITPWTTQTPRASHDPVGRGCRAGRDRAIPPGAGPPGPRFHDRESFVALGRDK